MTLTDIIRAGATERRAPLPLGDERPALSDRDLADVLAWCARQCRLLSRAADNAAVERLLEGGPGEDGAESQILGAMHALEAAMVIPDREAA